MSRMMRSANEFLPINRCVTNHLVQVVPPPKKNLRQNIEYKGLSFKIFRNKDLARLSPALASRFFYISTL